MSFDKAEWHYDGNFPSDLPTENGGRDFIINYCDEVLSNDFLSDEAILFARAY
jgi:hypothetical protein